MHPRMGLTLAVLVSLPASLGQAGDGFPPLLSRQRSALNAPLEELAADNTPEWALPARDSQGGIIQSGYHVPHPADCAPQPFPEPRRPYPPRDCPPDYPPRDCPPHAYQPQAVPPQHFQPQAVPPQAVPGMFAAPQARGEIAGESSSVGIRGFGIRIPAIQLEFPTIQLPSLIRFRREPEMRLEATYAPFVAGVPAVYGQLAPGGIAQVAPPMPPPPPQYPPYPQGQMVPPQQAPCPMPPASSPQSMSCDDQTLRQELAERERTIRELEAKLQRFQSLEQSLQQLSQQHQQLRQELQAPGTLPGCVPPAGKPEPPNPKIPAPAPTEAPSAPPARDTTGKKFFKVFD